MTRARRFGVRAERGYAMAALLVAMAVIGIALGAAMPVWSTMARREREAELIFRGEQYARAVALFQRRYANALPPDVDILINERFLRKRYKDPITGDDFELLGAATPLPGVTDPLGAAGRGGAQQGRGAQQGSGGAQQGGSQTSALQQQMEATRQRLAQMSQQLQQRAGGQLGSAGVPGGMIGVVSKSTERSMRLYNGRDRYNEWVFLGTGATTTPGAPGDAATQPGGGRGRGGQPGLELGGQGGRGGRGAAPGGRGGGRGFQGGQGGGSGGGRGFQPGPGGGAPGGGRGRGGG